MMDAGSVGAGSRGSLYPHLMDIISVDALDATELFSSPIGLQIDATEMESFDDENLGGSADSDRTNDTNSKRGPHRSGQEVSKAYASMDSRDGMSDDELWNDVEDLDTGSVYGEFALNDEDDEPDSKPAARKDSNPDDAAKHTQFASDTRSIGGGSVRSAKSVHTNPGVLQNSKAPRAKRVTAQQTSVVDRLAQFESDMTRVRSFGSVHSAGVLPQRAPEPGYEVAQSQVERDYHAMFKSNSGGALKAISAGRKYASTTQGGSTETTVSPSGNAVWVPTDHGNVNSISSQTKAMFGPPAYTATSASSGAHTSAQNRLLAGHKSMSASQPAHPLQRKPFMPTNEATYRSQPKPPTGPTPAAVIERSTGLQPTVQLGSTVSTTNNVQLLNFEKALKNLQPAPSRTLTKLNDGARLEQARLPKHRSGGLKDGAPILRESDVPSRKATHISQGMNGSASIQGHVGIIHETSNPSTYEQKKRGQEPRAPSSMELPMFAAETGMGKVKQKQKSASGKPSLASSNEGKQGKITTRHKRASSLGSLGRLLGRRHGKNKDKQRHNGDSQKKTMDFACCSPGNLNNRGEDDQTKYRNTGESDSLSALHAPSQPEGRRAWDSPPVEECNSEASKAKKDAIKDPAMKSGHPSTSSTTAQHSLSRPGASLVFGNRLARAYKREFSKASDQHQSPGSTQKGPRQQSKGGHSRVEETKRQLGLDQPSSIESNSFSSHPGNVRKPDNGRLTLSLGETPQHAGYEQAIMPSYIASSSYSPPPRNAGKPAKYQLALSPTAMSRQQPSK